MEALILAWYILIETRSVFLLTAFASLQWIGTLIAPMFGVVGDRQGHRNLLCFMRAFYATQAVLLMTLAYSGVLTPLLVFAISASMSLVRTSDLAMRYALIGATMPREHLMSATSIERTTVESARIVGALSGAGLIAWLGMGPAYTVVSSFYALSVLLTVAVRVKPAPGGEPPGALLAARASPWRDLLDAFGYVRRTPLLVATMSLAFLVNLTAYPFVLGLLPYVAKEMYHSDQTGLGYLAAGFAVGALSGSLTLMRFGGAIRAGRWMIVFAALWHIVLAVFAQQQSLLAGVCALVVAGWVQSFCLVPMSAILLRHSDEHYRGRVLGIRMFAIYGLPVGLLVAGPLISQFGFAVMAILYCLVGVAFTAVIALRWKQHVWTRAAPANTR